MERISIELNDDMTLGALRTLAQGMGKRLVLSFEGSATGAVRSARRGRPPGSGRKAAKATAAEGGAPAKAKQRKRRKLSPEARANLARNLMKARAVRSAKAKAARMGKA